VKRACVSFRRAVDLGRLDDLNLLLVRSVGDEASGFLITWQFTALAASLLWTRVSNLAGDPNRARTIRSDRFMLSVLGWLGNSWTKQIAIAASLAAAAAVLTVLTRSHDVMVGVFFVVGCAGFLFFLLFLAPTDRIDPPPVRTWVMWSLRLLVVAVATGWFIYRPLFWWALGAFVTLLVLDCVRDSWKGLRTAVSVTIIVFWSAAVACALALWIAVQSPAPVFAVMIIPATLGCLYWLLNLTEFGAKVLAVLVAPICGAALWATTRMAYGRAAANAALRLEIGAEATPVGTWSITELPWTQTDAAWAHSSYDDPHTTEILKAWMKRYTPRAPAEAAVAVT
jgi:hypothetical protein